MKVRLSQIEESNGKPMYTRKHKGKATKKKPLIGDIDEEDDEEDSDDDFNDNDDDGKKRLSKTMLHFKDEGITISAWDLAPYYMFALQTALLAVYELYLKNEPTINYLLSQ